MRVQYNIYILTFEVFVNFLVQKMPLKIRQLWNSNNYQWYSCVFNLITTYSFRSQSVDLFNTNSIYNYGITNQSSSIKFPLLRTAAMVQLNDSSRNWSSISSSDKINLEIFGVRYCFWTDKVIRILV